MYVLELAQSSGHARVHFAQTLGAAQRAARKHRVGGVWQAVPDDPRVKACLLDGERGLARVVRETVEYF